MENTYENGWVYYIENKEAYIIGAPGAEGDTFYLPETLGGYPVAEYYLFTNDFKDVSRLHLSKSIRRFDAACLTENISAITVDEKSPYFASRDGILYSKDYKTLVKYPPAKKDFAPSCLDGVEVIRAAAFEFTECITSLVIPDSVKEIGDAAFSFCGSLRHVEMPDSVTEIGASVFRETPLKSIRLSKSIKALSPLYRFGCAEKGFFSGTDLTEIVIPKGIEVIGEKTFSYCTELKRIYIPASVKEIGYHAFFECCSLVEFIVDEDNETFCSKDGVLYSRDGTLLSYPPARIADELIVPEGITKIGNYAFFMCKGINKLTLPEGVTEIASDAFLCSRIKKMNIPLGVKKLRSRVFQFTAFEELYLHNEVEAIEITGGPCIRTNPFKSTLLFVPEGSPAEKICREGDFLYKVIEE